MSGWFEGAYPELAFLLARGCVVVDTPPELVLPGCAVVRLEGPVLAVRAASCRLGRFASLARVATAPEARVDYPLEGLVEVLDPSLAERRLRGDVDATLVEHLAGEGFSRAVATRMSARPPGFATLASFLASRFDEVASLLSTDDGEARLANAEAARRLAGEQHIGLQAGRLAAATGDPVAWFRRLVSRIDGHPEAMQGIGPQWPRALTRRPGDLDALERLLRDLVGMRPDLGNLLGLQVVLRQRGRDGESAAIDRFIGASPALRAELLAELDTRILEATTPPRGDAD